MTEAAVLIPRSSQRVGVAAAGIVGSIALLVLLGWALNLPVLVRVAHEYPPTDPLLAVGLLAAAAGLFGIARHHRWMVSVSSAGSFLIGTAILLEYVANVHLGIDGFLLSGTALQAWPTPFPGRMPALSALSLILAGTALLGLHLTRWKADGHVLTGTLGAILTALAITLLLSYATGFLNSLRTGVTAGLSIPSCFAFGMTGVGLVSVAWRREHPIETLPRWVPYGAGIAMLIATVVIWRALETAENAAAFHSGLPLIVAGLGAAVSVLLTMTLRLLQRVHTTAQLAERERLARALESATDGLWERNERTGKSSRSPAVWRGLRYDPLEIDAPGNELTWESLIHAEDRPEYDARLQKHLAGGADSFELEYRVQAGDGDWHWIVDRGRIIERNEWGRPIRILGICADVTERKRSEQALTASEHRFRTMFDRGFQLELLLDVNCKLLEANRTALELIGMTLEEVRGKPFWDTPWWTGEQERHRLKCACDEALQGKTVRYQEEVRGPADRTTRLDFSITPIIDSEGRVVQLLAEGRDLSERQRGEDTMRELDTLSTMGRLAARVAHEINNPLAGIQNSFLLIKGAIPESHPYYSYVGAIEREIARMGAITRQLYETYRPDGDAREDASVPILISDAVTMLEQVNRAAQVRIEVDTSGSPPVLKLPGALLRQAVYNLVQNAVEASPPGGTVRVRAWRDDHTFWLSVTDQGPGVPADIRSRIFEPFVTTKTGLRTGGMGLGLSLVKRSVQALGGRIELRDPEGGGAEFCIAIPLR